MLRLASQTTQTLRLASSWREGATLVVACSQPLPTYDAHPLGSLT